MEKEGLYLCEKCGENVPDGGDFSSHLCAKDLTSVNGTIKAQLKSYKCPLCSEAFLMTGALKRHFRTHRDESKGPFHCSEQGCLFSVPDLRAYQDHLSSQHALTLVPCTFRSCSQAFRSQAEMQGHRRNHMPFHCPRCDFVTAQAKTLSAHCLEHDCPAAAPEGSENMTGLCGSSQPAPAPGTISGRPKTTRKRNSAYMSSSQEEDEEEHHNKRAKEEMHKDKSSVATNTNGHHHSKGHILEDTEHMYRTHMCPECRRCFKMRSHLQEHLHLHFPDPSLQCPTCKHHFTSKSKLRVHMLRESGQKVHRCHFCDYAAVERNSLRRHLASVHADEAGGEIHTDVYPCPSCGESFRQSRALKAHMKSHHTSRDGQPLVCFQEGCTFQSSDRKELLKHVADMHQVKAVECCHHACNAVFGNQEDMEAHHRTHLAFHCSLCDFCSSNKSLFQQHKRQGHAGDDELSCNFCPFTTFNLVEFQQHVSHFHASEKIHCCPQCNFVTAHKRVLGRHILMHSGEKPHKCNLCDFRCRDETYLSKHMLTHSDDKNHMCSECGYVTKWKHYLNVHMRKHAGDLRYQCDQCSYRCHRIDQLNSHKLRHQAKSLICEVCAYSCKRKYELRKHMLLKHPQGEGHQPPIFQCKYCTYQTCYRQALHNHENCKHTRTREFRCALCPYSTYSSTGLFLHKRKAHGYVPGDTLWLENYAKKESENNSVDLLQGFYMMSSQDGAKNSAEGPVENEREKDAVAGPLLQNGNNPKTVPAPETTETADSNADVVTQEMVNNGISASNYSTDNPEQYCTLALTTKAKTGSTGKTSMLSEKEICGDLTHRSTVDPKASQRDSPREMLAITSASEVEEDDVALEDHPNPSDPADGEAPLVSTSQQVQALENVPHTTEPAEAGRVSGSLAEPLVQATESEIHLKAMRKQDKDQAEALVLEGRVQMLVVQNEANGSVVYRCNHCSYVTRKQTSLQHHCQSVCHARWKDLKCKACGAQFKQKRGLDTHCLRKCPALRLRTRRFVRMPSAGQATVGESVHSQDGLEHPNKATSTDQSDTHPCVNETTRGSVAAQSELRGEEENGCILTNPKGSFEQGPNSRKQKSKGRRKIGKAKRHVKVGKCNKRRASENAEKVNPGNSKKDNAQSYTKDDEKLMCQICSFSSCRLATIERHCSMCTSKPPKKMAAGSPQKPDDCDNDEELEEEREKQNSNRIGDSGEDVLKVSKLGHKFSCPSCPFMCNQKRALDTHEKRGCMKANEVQCQLCSFVAKSKKALSNHVLMHQKNDQTPFKLGKKVVLRCKKCPFVCKQERCMTQHVALKHDGARPHRCRFCAFSTTRRYRLEAHESLHTGVGRHSCEICNRTFGTTSKLRQHRERVHDQDKQPCHFCSLCDFSSYTLNDIGRHTLSCHTGELQHICSKCEAPFSSDAALKQHCNRQHPSQDSLACLKCDFTCRSQASLRGHQQSKHPQLECTTCQEVFDTRESLEVHRRTHLAQRCQLCPFATRKRQLLVQHLLDKHEDGPAEDKPLKCAICEFACRHQLVFEQHARSHGGTRLYKCTDCQFSTRNKQKITWHIRIHTGEKPYHCEQCSYTCADPSRLKYHMRIHQEEKKYLCPECGYKCKWMSQLKYHMTKHTGDKPYSCEECEYRTNRGDALRIHQETRHRDTRSYICEKCGKGFKTRFLLKTHQRKHSEDRPYVCGLCSKAFRWPAGLRHHYLSHTGLQPFLCCHCPYRAKQRFQVVKHLQRHHPDQPVEQGVIKDPSALSLTLQEARVGSLGEEEEVVEESLVQEVKEAVTEEG